MDMTEVTRLQPPAAQATDFNANKLEAYEIVRAIPTNLFVPGLGMFLSGEIPKNRTKESAFECGTLACGAGWVALSGRFPRCWNSGNEDWESWMLKYFGPKAWECFSYHSGSIFDRENHAAEMSDKKLVMYRLLRSVGFQPFKAAWKVHADTR